MTSLEELLDEMETWGFLLHSLFEKSEYYPASEIDPEVRRWNVRLKCPTSRLYALGAADTPNEAFRLALDAAKETDKWKPTLSQLREDRPEKTLDDVLSFLPKPTEPSAS